ncbi:MAG: sigma-54-dependent Fis family transcriptional regulator [Candidatus Desulfofervidaceae bacterium]|nr:sigma-54-dependent Fis family transcriptional regulator [Candidatus Desulfofervidaceae bacterium]
MKNLEIVDGITFDCLFNHSESMRRIGTLIKEVAPTNMPILITGESGTGKSLIAKAIHKLSARAQKPFVTVSCINTPAELLENELFGYEKGAFTGAYQSKPGRVEFANHGTLFLDEIGDIPLTTQGKLLRLIQEGEFSRLGGYRDIKADVRFVSATNRNLELVMKEGKFREDLYFRINVINIKLPPLRQKQEEIPFWVRFFQKKFCKEYNRSKRKISQHCMDLLTQYHWPGNIRELENAIKRLVVLGEKLVVQELEKALGEDLKPPQVKFEVKLETTNNEYNLKKIARIAAREAERQAIEEVLEKVKWNKKEAARVLRISYKALLYKIKNLRIA